MGFACLSSTFLSLTADGFTTGFRKLYLKEMKNKVARTEPAFSRESCSLQVMPFSAWEPNNAYRLARNFSRERNAFLVRWYWQMGQPVEEFCSFTILIRCSQPERSVWCECFSAIGAGLLEASPRPVIPWTPSRSSLELMTEACQDEGCLKMKWVHHQLGLNRYGKSTCQESRIHRCQVLARCPPGVFAVIEAWTSRSDDAAVPITCKYNFPFFYIYFSTFF